MAAQISDSGQVLLTQEGLESLKKELENLKTVKRREVAERLKEAISYGDLSENSEYEEAKNEQAFIEGRIIELEKKIKNAQIISGKASKTALVQVGSTITLSFGGGEKKDQEKYTIVGSTEADPTQNRISNESPIGAALIGKSKGDTVTVAVPAGNIKCTIVDLK